MNSSRRAPVGKSREASLIGLDLEYRKAKMVKETFALNLKLPYLLRYSECTVLAQDPPSTSTANVNISLRLDIGAIHFLLDHLL